MRCNNDYVTTLTKSCLTFILKHFFFYIYKIGLNNREESRKNPTTHHPRVHRNFYIFPSIIDVYVSFSHELINHTHTHTAPPNRRDTHTHIKLAKSATRNARCEIKHVKREILCVLLCNHYRCRCSIAAVLCPVSNHTQPFVRSVLSKVKCVPPVSTAHACGNKKL